MKYHINLLFYIFLFLLFPLEGKGVSEERADRPSHQDGTGQTAILLAQLDSAITHIREFDDAHEKDIEAIKERLRHRNGSLAEEISLTDKLIEAYSKFNYDSTTLYINRNLQLAEQSGNQGTIIRMKLLKAQYYAKTGSYLEAVNIISKIDENHLPDSILPLFYDACRHVYGEAGYYSHDSEINAGYLDKAGQYRFLLQQYYSKLPESDIYLETLETFARNQQDYEAALKYSDKRLEHIDSLSKKYSEVAYFRSLIYKGLGEKEKEKQWLIRSAIGDLRHSIKDQASLWTLADMLSGDGDVKRSYLLINISQDGLQQYSSPLRNLQSIDILNNIAHNYQQMTNNQNHKLSVMLLLVGVLALLLGIAVLYVIRQMRKLRVARRELDENNQELTKLNNELQQTIKKLHESYNLLNESNRMKEVYLGNFLALCSDYITKIEAFRSTVLKKQKSGQLSSFLSPSKMRVMKSKDCNELLGNFYVAFLNIIPTFIEEFNALLLPEYRITPPNSNSLTTELRIFALIRMGITDSSKIAEFLNYSVHTIYNYRSTVKNAAIGPRDEFEDAVKQIGTAQQPF